jgi:ABC-type glycerol-3-phosphate transport system permease component
VRKIFYVVAALFILVFCLPIFWIFIGSIPPSDATLVKQFYDNRNDFEKLRGMFQQDSNIVQVAAHGVIH